MAPMHAAEDHVFAVRELRPEADATAGFAVVQRAGHRTEPGAAVARRQHQGGTVRGLFPEHPTRVMRALMQPIKAIKIQGSPDPLNHATRPDLMLWYDHDAQTLRIRRDHERGHDEIRVDLTVAEGQQLLEALGELLPAKREEDYNFLDE